MMDNLKAGMHMGWQISWNINALKCPIELLEWESNYKHSQTQIDNYSICEENRRQKPI